MFPNSDLVPEGRNEEYRLLNGVSRGYCTSVGVSLCVSFSRSLERDVGVSGKKPDEIFSLEVMFCRGFSLHPTMLSNIG